jgi:hypothetical protein
MSWDAPYPEWPLPQRKDLLYQLLAQDADTFGGDAVQQNNALSNFTAPTYNIGRAPNSGVITDEEPFNLAELFKSEAEPAPTVPEIDPRSPGNQFIEEAKQPATDVVTPFLQPETLSQLPADLKAPEAKEEEPAQNESAKYDYNEKNWPSIIPGSTDEDGRFLTKTTTTDGTPFYLRDDDGGGMYQNPATVETFERVTSPDGQTYYKVHAPVFSSGKEAYETPVTSVVSEAQYKAIKGPGSIQSVLNSPIGSFALNLLGPYGQIINAANAANQGNVAGAVLSGLNAAGGFGVADIGGVPVKDITNTINFAKAAESGDPLSILMSGANLGGVTDVGGVKLQDVSRGIGAIKAIESGNPVAIMNALVGYKPKESAPTEIPIEPEIPFTPEEEAERIENRMNSAIASSQVSPEEQDENTRRAIEELERMYGPAETDTLPSSTRSLSGTQVDEADDFLKSIGINTIDKTSDSGLSNQDIDNIINGGNEMVITGNLNKVPVSSPIDDYFTPISKKDDEVKITGTKGLPVEPPVSSPIDDYFKTIPKDADILEIIGSLTPPALNPTIPDYIAPVDTVDDNELVMTADRPYNLNPTIPDYIAPVDTIDEYNRDFDIDEINPKLPTVVPGITTPKASAVKVPTKAPTAAKPAASSGMDLSSLLALLAASQQPQQQAPMQDPYAHIKLMEDLFGSTIDVNGNR